MSRIRGRKADIWELHAVNEGSHIDEYQHNFAYSETCGDSLGPKTDHDFYLVRTTHDGGDIHWGSKPATLLDGRAGCSLMAHEWYWEAQAFADQFTAKRIAISTAPLRPAVYSLTNLLEFRDIPRMLKHAGDVFHHLRKDPLKLASGKQIANATLAYQFGWAPLFQDLMKVMDFGKYVDKRHKLLTALANGETVRRRANFGSISASSKGDNAYPFSGYGYLISCKWSSVMRTEAWGTTRWKLADKNMIGKRPTWLQAANSLYGITPGEIPVQIWKALPWTWMIDWFADISNSLELSKNLLQYDLQSVCLMWKTTVTDSFPIVRGSGRNVWGPMNARYTRLNRKVLSPSSASMIHITVPHLDPYKLSVLGSLGILKL